MSKKLCFILLILIIAMPLFCEVNSIVYNYDYNRFRKGTKDLIIGLGVDFNKKEYNFRNSYTKNQDKKEKNGISFLVEFVERRKGWSWYQNFDFGKYNVKLTSEEEKINSFVLRVGLQKDLLWTVGNAPFTVYFGGGVSGRFDWIKDKKEQYNNVSYLGITAKAGIVLHFSQKNGIFSLFAQYQPDYYIITNAPSANSGFVFKSKYFTFNNTVTVGLHINPISMARSINQAKAERLAKNISELN